MQKEKTTKKELIIMPDERIVSKIVLIRGKKVIIDRDIAELYKTETKQLKRAVSRNITRFPNDFMFQLNKQETKILRCQIGTSSWGGTRYSPMVFTEQGVAMLSSVLNSERAIRVNIQIIRTFIKLRELLATNKKLKQKIESMEKKYDKQLKLIFEAMRQLLTEKEKPKKEIGFKLKKK